MLSYLLQVFAPAITEETAHKRMTLHLSVILCVIVALCTLDFLIDSIESSKVFAGITLVYSLVSIILLRQGRIRFSQLTVPFVCWIFASMLIWNGYGLHSVKTPGLTLPIIFAALLAGYVPSIFYMILGIITLAAVLVGEHRGYVDNGLPHTSTSVEFSILCMSLVLLTIAIRTLMRNLMIERNLAKASEANYRLLAENIHDFIWTVNLELNYTYASPSCYRLFGYKPAEFIGISVMRTMHPDSMGPVSDAVLEEIQLEAKGADPNRSRVSEMQFFHKDGSSVWVEVHASFLRDVAGKAVGIVGTSCDITARKAAELDRKFIQAQLQQAHRMESIGQFAGGIAHDFNNILVALQGYSDLLLMSDDLTEADALKVREVQKASDRAAILTRQLLTFGRPKLSEVSPINLNALILDIENMLTRLLPESIQCEINLYNELENIIGDQGQLEQLLVNLSVNARDAMPGGGLLSLSTTRFVLDDDDDVSIPGATPGRYAVLSVADNGTGMKPRVLESIFDPFFTTKAVGKGTGLGMSVVHGIVLAHHAKIQIRSEENSGTCVEIYFPAVDTEVETSVLEKELEPLGGNETLLLVEDDSQVRRFAKQILSKAGYRVLCAQDGVDGVEQYRAHSQEVSLIVTDVVMPRMGGREMMGMIQAIDEQAAFLFTSGYLADETHTQFLSDGKLELLQKPYTPRTLLTFVRAQIDRAQSVP